MFDLVVTLPDGDLVAALGIASQESIRRSVESDGVLSLRRMVSKDPRVFKYLSKNHLAELGKLQDLLAEFERTCQAST